MVFQIFGQLTTNLLAELPLLCVHKLQIVSSISFRSHESSPRATNGIRRMTRTNLVYILLPAIFLESDISFMSWWNLHVSFYKIMCNLKITHLKANVDYKGSQSIINVFLLLSVDLHVNHDKHCFYNKLKTKNCTWMCIESMTYNF